MDAGINGRGASGGTVDGGAAMSEREEGWDEWAFARSMGGGTFACSRAC